MCLFDFSFVPVLSLKKRKSCDCFLDCSCLYVLKELTVLVIELIKEEKTPMASRITHTAKNLASDGDACFTHVQSRVATSQKNRLNKKGQL